LYSIVDERVMTGVGRAMNEMEGNDNGRMEERRVGRDGTGAGEAGGKMKRPLTLIA